MHAFLFVGGRTENREDEMLKRAKRKGQVYEFPLVKIADVRALSDFTKYTQSSAISIAIKDIEGATREALNAFLKNLEEPGKNISYFLSCSNEQKLLPTIVSRCQIIRFTSPSEKEVKDIAADFLKLSFGHKIKKFATLKKRDEAILFLKNLVLSAHRQMLQKDQNSMTMISLIKAAQRAVFNLNINANVSLEMTNFAINSEKTSFTKNV